MPRKGIVTTNPLYWMPVNIQEWMAKLAGSLTTEQFGAAVLLLFTSWDQRPPCTLPADPAFLAQKSGLGPKWSRHGATILAACQLYEGQDGRLRADWLQTIHAEQLERYEHRSRAGKENRAKREQHELALDAPKPAKKRRNPGTNEGTNGRTATSQKEKGEGVPPSEVTPDPLQNRTPDALAPEGARAGSVDGEPNVSNVRNALPDNQPAPAGSVIRQAMDALWATMSPVERSRARQLAEARQT